MGWTQIDAREPITLDTAENSFQEYGDGIKWNVAGSCWTKKLSENGMISKKLGGVFRNGYWTMPNRKSADKLMKLVDDLKAEYKITVPFDVSAQKCKSSFLLFVSDRSQVLEVGIYDRDVVHCRVADAEHINNNRRQIKELNAIYNTAF